ncbi:MAG TPA: GTP-binding protein [Stellaceae bacterium]|nr:GTP-binding protein [Stellaceae bacterium]
MAEERLPIALLTGFLGSGKTSLLRRALAGGGWTDTAVLINELGEIGLDHYLVDTIDGPVLELPGGCLCCAIREDLALSLRRLLERRDAGLLPPFRRVAIETTGLADPAPILFTLGADALLETRLRLGSVTATVDAVSGAATLARYVEAARQVAIADHLVLTKTDLAPGDAGLRATLAALNPAAASRLAAAPADVGALLFGPSPESRPPLPAAAPSGHHTHGIESHALLLHGPCSRLDFARALGGLARERGEALLRVKGILCFSDRPDRPAFIQGAQHALYPPVWLERWPDDDRRSRLQFIVHGIAQDEILARFAFAGAAPAKDDHTEGEHACLT